MPKYTEKAAAAATHQLSITGYYCSHSTQLGQQDSTACFTVYTTVQSHVSQWHTSSTAEAINVFFPYCKLVHKGQSRLQEPFLSSPVFFPQSILFSILYNPSSSDPAFQSVFSTAVCNTSILPPTLGTNMNVPAKAFLFLHFPQQQCQVCHFSACSTDRELKAPRENSNHVPCLLSLPLKPHVLPPPQARKAKPSRCAYTTVSYSAHFMSYY